MTQSSTTFAQLVGYPSTRGTTPEEVHGTTVLALRYKDGVIVLADRRATMGNLIMFDQAEKIVPLDDSTVVAISGSFARSIEMARFLKHSFKYYRRVVLDELSLEGKLMEVSRALASNMEAAMQGIGVFLPILAAYDKAHDTFRLYFFDGAGARFETPYYACAGSGSERIRGVFEYVGRTKGDFAKKSLEDALLEGLYMLDIAADLDSATGGFGKILPAAVKLTRSGVEPIEEKVLRRTADKVLVTGN